MGQVARNSLKGYTFQQYIFTLFIAKMDVERNISSVETEAIVENNFDDLYIEAEKKYRIQVKNYRDTLLEDINISEQLVTIKGNKNKFIPEENNVLIINTDKIDTNTEFMGMKAIKINGIIIIPLTSFNIQNMLDEMFREESREIQIIQFAYMKCTNAIFSISITDLPELIRISTDLEQQTIVIREPLEKWESGITCIVGKPGIGKSHYVNELTQKYRDAIIYRFWTGSQDGRIKHRLLFESFLGDLALGIFESPRNFTLEQLIETINEQHRMIIIDGLDHVENYNPADLNDYFNFISKLTKAYVIVLTRPLKAEIKWNIMEISNWNYDETALYLAMSHNINDYNVVRKIYEVTDGYPIITFFLAEHYKKYSEINVDDHLKDLNQYYDILLEHVNTKTALCIFATNDSFFLESEITGLLKNEALAMIVKEFISEYPYLFNVMLNRISLIHDSLNTYLRMELQSFPQVLQQVNEVVKESLLAGKVEYMSRLSSFYLEDDFYDKLLFIYSEPDIFSRLLISTFDYNSITDLYTQLQKILEKRRGIFDIYQYYAFALIYEMVNRNDLIGYEGLLYQILVFVHQHGAVEEELFSSGVMWNEYYVLKSSDEAVFKKYLNDKMYDSNQIYELYNAVEAESTFFDKKEDIHDYKVIMEKLHDNKIYQFDKQEILIYYMIQVWCNNEMENEYYRIVDNYVTHNNEKQSVDELKKIIKFFDIETMWVTRILSSVRYKIYEMGKLGEKNIFRGKSLKQIIIETASKGSFETAKFVNSYIRLANHERRDIDINSVNYLWIMYYNHKDNSVSTMDDALRVFEKHGLIKEDLSVDIIRKVMNQSDKGIRLLLTNYINGKDLDFTSRLIKKGMFKDKSFAVDIFDLTSERIECFDKRTIDDRIRKLISYHRRSGWIEYNDICNVIATKYCNRVLGALDYFDFQVWGSTDDKDIERIFTDAGIKYSIKEQQEVKGYIPFENGCIHEKDKCYIIKHGIDYKEISKYADGWHSCLPFVDLYLLYDQNEVRREYIDIIHNSMFARVSDKEYIGLWYLLIGNIPLFLEQTEIDVDWIKIFDIFKFFLKESSIYFWE